MEEEENEPVSLPPQPPSAVIVNRRLMVWGADGLPVPSSSPLITKPQLEALAGAAMSLPYVDPLGLDGGEFDGLTNAEVMMIRMARKAAEGDLAVASELLDRVLGRPKQSVESKSIRMSYEDVLKEMARQQQGFSDIPPSSDAAAADDDWGEGLTR